MLTLEGRVLGILRHAERVYKGETKPAYAQVQLMVREALQDGQERVGVQTFTTEQPDAFEAHQGCDVTFPVRAYVGKTGVAFSIGRDTRPQPLSS